MHKLAFGSKSIDGLYWCLQTPQIDAFVNLYLRTRRTNPRFAACMLRQYRRRRPWLNLFFNDCGGQEQANYRVPGGCGTYGHDTSRGALYSHHSILYGVMNLILMIKQRQKVPWDYWGWHGRRAHQRLDGGHGVGVYFIQGSLAGLSRQEVMRDVGFSEEWISEWIAKYPGERSLLLGTPLTSSTPGARK